MSYAHFMFVSCAVVIFLLLWSHSTPQHIVTRLTLILGAVIHDTPRISDTIRHTNAEPGRGGKSPTPTTTTHHCKSTMYVFHYDLLLLLVEGYLISTRMYVCRILGWRILMEQ